jgi:hypothetical protein
MLNACFGTYGEHRMFCQDPGVNVGDIELLQFSTGLWSLTDIRIILKVRIGSDF